MFIEDAGGKPTGIGGIFSDDVGGKPTDIGGIFGEDVGGRPAGIGGIFGKGVGGKFAGIGGIFGEGDNTCSNLRAGIGWAKAAGSDANTMNNAGMTARNIILGIF